MNLKDIASIAGKSGLFKVIKPTRTGVILESIDAQKTKLIANSNSRVSILKEISMYTTNTEASKPLEDVFAAIYAKYGKSIDVNSKSDGAALSGFLGSVLPEYDRERVYQSDIKKLVSWYLILVEHHPEVFQQASETVSEETTPELVEAEAEEEQPKAKKAAKKKA